MRRLARAVIGVLPAAFVIALVSSPAIQGEIELTIAMLAIALGVVGLIAGAVMGAGQAGRPNSAGIGGLLTPFLVLVGIAAALAVWGIVGGGIPDDEDQPNFYGTWSLAGTDTERLVRYEVWNTYVMELEDESGTKTPFDQGTISIDQGLHGLSGQTYSLTYMSRDSGVCEDDQTGHYEVEELGTDQWRIHLVEDQCAARSEGAPFTHRLP